MHKYNGLQTWQHISFSCFQNPGAITKLQKGLKAGDKVKFEKGDMSFEQIIESMQLEHKQVNKGKKGEEIAVKVDQVAKDGVGVYKM